jgi:hypothetical protein
MMLFFMFGHQKQGLGGEDHFVTHFVAHGADDFNATFGKGYNLVCTVGVFAP